jgi:hypothetical protein
VRLDLINAMKFAVSVLALAAARKGSVKTSLFRATQRLRFSSLGSRGEGSFMKQRSDT